MQILVPKHKEWKQMNEIKRMEAGIDRKEWFGGSTGKRSDVPSKL